LIVNFDLKLHHELITSDSRARASARWFCRNWLPGGWHSRPEGSRTTLPCAKVFTAHCCDTFCQKPDDFDKRHAIKDLVSIALSFSGFA